MAQTKADKLLSRITALHRSLRLEDEEDTPSPLERDLMLGYLRDLYAVYLDVDTERSDAPPPPRENPAPTPEPQPVVPPPPPTPPREPEVKQLPEEKPAPAAPPEAPGVPVPPPPAPPYAEHTAPIDPRFDSRPASPAGPRIEALFQDTEEHGSLGNHLVRQRVTDLNRSLSINNRVLFAKKLFHGNDDLNDALKSLNLKGSMENAKPMLVELAQRHRWAEEEREETAREFIDLVRRRYA